MDRSHKTQDFDPGDNVKHTDFFVTMTMLVTYAVFRMRTAVLSFLISLPNANC